MSSASSFVDPINAEYREVVKAEKAAEFERLCEELADVDRKLSLLNTRRQQIEAQLKRTIRDLREEHYEEISEHRLLKRLERKAAAEERERVVEERRARITPEAQARLRASIAELKERQNGQAS